MAFLKNKNKITGKRLNDVAEAYAPIGKVIPLDEEICAVNEEATRLLRMRSDGPILGAVVRDPEDPFRGIDHRAIDGTFDDSDELDISVDDMHYIIRDGKDRYDVPLQYYDRSKPRVPHLDHPYSVTLDPAVLRSLGSHTKKGVRYHLTFRGGYDKSGSSILYLLLVEDGKNGQKVIAHEIIPFNGVYAPDTVQVTIAWELIRDFLTMKDLLTVNFDTDYPVDISWGGESKDYSASSLIAPLVNRGDWDMTPMYDEYIASLCRRCRGRY